MLDIDALKIYGEDGHRYIERNLEPNVKALLLISDLDPDLNPVYGNYSLSPAGFTFNSRS